MEVVVEEKADRKYKTVQCGHIGCNETFIHPETLRRHEEKCTKHINCGESCSRNQRKKGLKKSESTFYIYVNKSEAEVQMREQQELKYMNKGSFNPKSESVSTLSRHILNLPRAKGNSTLQSLAERFKITVTNAHRANGDVDVLWQIIQHLVDAKNEAAVEKWIFICNGILKSMPSVE
jgi:hypothetical protein